MQVATDDPRTEPDGNGDQPTLDGANQASEPATKPTAEIETATRERKYELHIDGDNIREIEVLNKIGDDATDRSDTPFPALGPVDLAALGTHVGHDAAAAVDAALASVEPFRAGDSPVPGTKQWRLGLIHAAALDGVKLEIRACSTSYVGTVPIEHEAKPTLRIGGRKASAKA